MTNIRSAAKRIPLLARLNAHRRAVEAELRYRNFRRTYGSGSSLESFDRLFAGRALGSRTSAPETERVAFFGTDPLQDYGGFIQSLARHCDLRVVEGSGWYGQDVRPGSQAANHERLSSFLTQEEATGWTPTLLMMQGMGSRISASGMAEIKDKYSAPLINVGMDERLSYARHQRGSLEQGIRALNPVVDLALVTVPEAVQWYAGEGVPAKYFPLASDPSVYFKDADTEPKFDVGFVGRAYGQRRRIATLVHRNGFHFEARGPGWPSGPLEPAQCNRFYNNCHIVLGAGNIGYSKSLMNPKLRDFEAPLTGALYLTNYTPELADLYVDGEEIVLYRDHADLIDKLDFFCSNPEAASVIGMRGRQRALRDHTYDARLSVLFDSLLAGSSDAEFFARDGEGQMQDRTSS